MAKKQSTSADPASPGHMLYNKLTPRESRVLTTSGKDEQTDQTPSKK